jgi:insertion element IS1 protein InsB
MKCGILYVKKTKKWIIKAIDRSTGKCIAWVTGNRDIATFRQLYDKVKHLSKCMFYTDDWDAFSAVLPEERHVVGKQHTQSELNKTIVIRGII